VYVCGLDTIKRSDELPRARLAILSATASGTVGNVVKHALTVVRRADLSLRMSNQPSNNRLRRLHLAHLHARGDPGP
jgi:hypothetical protein